MRKLVILGAAAGAYLAVWLWGNLSMTFPSKKEREMTEKFTCPRRNESPNPEAYGGLGSDTWRKGRPLGGSENIAPEFRSCSYCGSMHPDDFFAAIERGDVIGPTDKSYKAYVSKPVDDVTWQRYKDRMPGMYDEVRPDHDYGKFYFQHLSEEQKLAFIDAVNTKRMKIGYPGHFYRLPFFCRHQEPEGAN